MRQIIYLFIQLTIQMVQTTAMTFRRLLCLLMMLVMHAGVYAQASGVITGTIKDKKTQEPIPSVTVTLEGTTTGAASDFEGSFRIDNIPPKTYNLKIQAVDYKPQVIYNVVVLSLIHI